MVRDLERRVRLAKTNVEVMCNIMAKWSETPLYQRKDKRDCLLNLDVCLYMSKALPFGLENGDHILMINV